jgi:hypothetical protein
MRLAAFASLSLLSLAACVHASPFYGPNGERGFQIRCGGRFNDMSDCYNRAYQECHGPYDIAGGQDDQRVVYGFNGQPIVRDHRELTVTCRQ